MFLLALLAIHIDQAGYLPTAPKTAVVVAAQPASEFTVHDATGKVVFKGTLSQPVNDPDTGESVQQADFSKLIKPGKYHVEAAGAGKSYPFSIGNDAYSRPLYLAMRSFYGQRCGAAVDLGPEFPGYRYQACHQQGAYHPSSGRTGPRASIKGWHDAGDYGRYIVNSGISTGTLLWAYELYAPKLRKLKLNIPESTNNTPDFLDEIRWNLDWMITMQDDDGGIFHKQTTERFSGFVMPHEDKMPSLVIGKGTCASADFAAVMAIASRLYKPFDPAFAATSLDAARKAWTWASKNPNVLFNNPQGVNTGAYGDRDCGDELLWAAAELWRTTADPGYERYFLDNQSKYRASIRPAGPPSWNSVAPFAYWAYVLGRGKEAEPIKADILSAAKLIADRTASAPYRNSMTTKDYIWGSNGVASNYSVQLLVANAIERNPRLVHAAIDNVHYMLGRNTFSLSWLTQVGANPYKHPHHRPSGADTNPEPWPGMLSGGPNARPQDPAMKKLGQLPPAKMFIDDQESYASNEMAINWNAPLVFTLAGIQPE